MAKKAIVMGATSGIGMEVAKLLAAKGWQVGIAGRRIERLQALISQGGITCYQQIDVTSPMLLPNFSNSSISWEAWTSTSIVPALAGRITTLDIEKS